jgi:hypothetical protein
MLTPRTLMPMPSILPLALPTSLTLPMGPTSLVLLNTVVLVLFLLLWFVDIYVLSRVFYYTYSLVMTIFVV